MKCEGSNANAYSEDSLFEVKTLHVSIQLFYKYLFKSLSALIL